MDDERRRRAVDVVEIARLRTVIAPGSIECRRRFMLSEWVELAALIGADLRDDLEAQGLVMLFERLHHRLPRCSGPDCGECRFPPDPLLASQS